MKRKTNPEAGKLIRQYRERMGVSQFMLAAMSDIRQSSVHYIETGRDGMGLITMSALADSLQLDTRDRVKLVEAAGFRLTPRGK